MRLSGESWPGMEKRVTFNERWYGMLGYSPGELEPLVSTWMAQVHPQDRGELHRRLDTHLRGESSVYQTEYRLRGFPLLT